MDKELQDLVAVYREKVAKWEGLLDIESQKRDAMIVASGDKENEPENLRERLDDYAVDSGLRDKQHDALVELKEAERKLFTWHLDHTESEDEMDELKQLARDYAGRITWLRRHLEDPEDAEA